MQQLPDIVSKFAGTQIVVRPTDRLKEIKQEVRESNQRLQSVKSGRPIDHCLQAPFSLCEVEDAPYLELSYSNSLNPLFSTKADYVYPPGAVPRDSAADIQNEFNILRHCINEEDMQRNNRLMKEINHRNRRRHYAMPKQYKDFRRNGIKASAKRAQRESQLSALKTERCEPWWPAFVEDRGKIGENLEILERIAKIQTFAEPDMRNVYRGALLKGRGAPQLREYLERANEMGNFLPDWELSSLFDRLEENAPRRSRVTTNDDE
jgi:light-regulated signal transduction histidine kinase (bacteriophytochrome)